MLSQIKLKSPEEFAKECILQETNEDEPFTSNCQENCLLSSKAKAEEALSSSEVNDCTSIDGGTTSSFENIFEPSHEDSDIFFFSLSSSKQEPNEAMQEVFILLKGYYIIILFFSLPYEM